MPRISETQCHRRALGLRCESRFPLEASELNELAQDGALVLELKQLLVYRQPWPGVAHRPILPVAFAHRSTSGQYQTRAWRRWATGSGKSG